MGGGFSGGVADRVPSISAIEGLLRRGRFREALRLLQAAPAGAYLNQAEVLALQAEALAGLAEFDDALRTAGQALALEPAVARAHTVLGNIALDVQGKPQEALHRFQAALQADPDFAPAHYALGLLLMKAGHEIPAAQHLRRAQALDPGNWRYAGGVALLAPARERPRLMRAAYRDGLRDEPGTLGLRVRILGTYLAGLLAVVVPAARPSARQAQLGIAAYQRLLARPVVVTYLLLAVNVAMFLFLETHGGSQDNATLDRYGALDGTLIVHQGQWWRLLTPVFLHAGFTHLLVNGASLYFVGALYERCVGPLRFLLVYFFAGLGGNVLSLALGVNGVGASGAIFGIFGALGVFFFLNRALFGRIASSLLKQVLFFTAVNLLLPTVVANVNGWAHLGGLLTGLAMAVVVGPLLPAPSDGVTVEEALAERRPVRLVALWVLLAAVMLVTITIGIIVWNPAGV